MFYLVNISALVIISIIVCGILLRSDSVYLLAYITDRNVGYL